MENKYFTPSVEDIRVGYEGEYHNWSMDEAGVDELNYNRWEKATLNKGNVETMLKYGIGEFRVPYLTKEQIEAEGWEDMIGYLYKNYRRLNFNSETNKLQIYDMFNNIFYVGKCKCINDFRYITKLLGI